MQITVPVFFLNGCCLDNFNEIFHKSLSPFTLGFNWVIFWCLNARCSENSLILCPLNRGPLSDFSVSGMPNMKNIFSRILITSSDVSRFTFSTMGNLEHSSIIRLLVGHKNHTHMIYLVYLEFPSSSKVQRHTIRQLLDKQGTSLHNLCVRCVSWDPLRGFRSVLRWLSLLLNLLS